MEADQNPHIGLLQASSNIFECEHGHQCRTTKATAPKCSICPIMNVLWTNDQGITNIYNMYNDGDSKFEMRCSMGHRFISSRRRAKTGCNTCNTLSRSPYGDQLEVDERSLNIHADSPLRLRCRRPMHNPGCMSLHCAHLRRMYPSLSINDNLFACDTPTTTCGMEFYATSYQLKHVLGVMICEKNHTLKTPSVMATSKRTFEVLFGQRFDDDTFYHGIEFTGYSRELKLAFTHMRDKVPSSTCRRAREWCNANSVLFIIIPADIIRTVDVNRFVVTHLALHDIVNNVEFTFNLLRENIKNLNRHHVLFPKDC